MDAESIGNGFLFVFNGTMLFNSDLYKIKLQNMTELDLDFSKLLNVKFNIANGLPIYEFLNSVV